MKNGRYEENGDVYWYKDDVLHREDGPAVVYAKGDKWWYIDGLLHRRDGHAIERACGSKEWYVDGKCHRLDGPAIEWADGDREWWVDGQFVDIMTIFGYLPSVPLSPEEQMILRLAT